MVILIYFWKNKEKWFIKIYIIFFKDKWMNGKMSNLKYLLYLNNLASRSFKDLS